MSIFKTLRTPAMMALVILGSVVVGKYEWEYLSIQQRDHLGLMRIYGDPNRYLLLEDTDEGGAQHYFYCIEGKSPFGGNEISRLGWTTDKTASTVQEWDHDYGEVVVRELFNLSKKVTPLRYAIHIPKGAAIHKVSPGEASEALMICDYEK